MCVHVCVMIDTVKPFYKMYVPVQNPIRVCDSFNCSMFSPSFDIIQHWHYELCIYISIYLCIILAIPVRVVMFHCDFNLQVSGD